MSTRHNVIFMGNEFTYEDKDGNKKTANELRFKKDGSIYKQCIKNSPKVYVHWDGYPIAKSENGYFGALPILTNFLNSEGARSRMHDEQYLSAYYIGWKIIHDFGHTNLKDLDDYRGIGIETTLSDWADWNYIIKPEAKSHNNYKFTIYVLDYNLKLVAKIEQMDIELIAEKHPELVV